jgi:hypothetical protein
MLSLHSHALRGFPIKPLAFPAPVFIPAESIMNGKASTISFDRAMPCVRRPRGGRCVRLPAASPHEIEVLQIEYPSQKEGAEIPLKTSTV